ncbi:MAG: FGGY family carbohydrate kinase [Anaerolineae bacterium]|nr:FGGY family carbohydrate kinase [Anaerolineae bacterium]
MLLMGIDIGTTGCKVALFDDSGTLLYQTFRECTVLIPQAGWAEQDLDTVWRMVKDAIREIIAKAGEDPVCGEEIHAVGFSVQGEAVVPVDISGNPLRNAILGMDTRTAAQNAQLCEVFGARSLFEMTGMPVHTINTLPKLLWLKDNERHIWRSADKFLLYEDYFIGKMTGKPFISRCLASRTQLYDTKARTWSGSILDFLDLQPTKLAEITPSGSPVGHMHSSLAAALGFSTPPLIVTGGHDQACGALGVGLTEPGHAMVSTGSAEVVEVVSQEPFLNTSLYEGNMSVYAHTLPDRYLTMTLNHSGGLLLRWFRDTFGQLEIQQAAHEGKDAYQKLLENAGVEPSGLFVLPHFSGSGTPTFDAASKGAILGLTFATTKADLAKAILEGLTYELQINIEVLKNGGVQIDELRAIGGGARSPLWLQLKADITGLPVVVPRVTEAACWGAALLAGYAAGRYPSIEGAAQHAVAFNQRYVPDSERSERYAALFSLYRNVYPAVKDIHHQLV